MASKTNLVIGRGQLFFDRFAPGTKQGEGELYLGNTPGFSLSISFEEVRRAVSYGGRKYTQPNQVVREMMSGRIVTDNISLDNIGIWFGRSPVVDTVTTVGTISETFVIKRGRHYQLGSSVRPQGLSYLKDDAVFEVDGSPLSLDGNILFEPRDGRFFVLPDAEDVEDGDEVEVTFGHFQNVGTRSSAAGQSIEGSLRFIAANEIGPKIDHFFPHVVLRPVGQIDMKGDNWQELNFEIDVRRIGPTAEMHYFLRRSEYSSDELHVLYDLQLEIDDMTSIESLLNDIINTDLPAALA